MGTVSINDKLKKTYLTLIKGLGEDEILEIISELSLFLKKAKANNRNKVDFYSGSWSSEKSAEQIIFEVQELQIERSRVFNNVFAGHKHSYLPFLKVTPLLPLKYKMQVWKNVIFLKCP